jgi:hypothetical protein
MTMGITHAEWSWWSPVLQLLSPILSWNSSLHSDSTVICGRLFLIIILKFGPLLLAEDCIQQPRSMVDRFLHPQPIVQEILLGLGVTGFTMPGVVCKLTSAHIACACGPSSKRSVGLAGHLFSGCMHSDFRTLYQRSSVAVVFSIMLGFESLISQYMFNICWVCGPTVSGLSFQ